MRKFFLLFILLASSLGGANAYITITCGIQLRVTNAR